MKHLVPGKDLVKVMPVMVEQAPLDKVADQAKQRSKVRVKLAEVALVAALVSQVRAVQTQTLKDLVAVAHQLNPLVDQVPPQEVEKVNFTFFN